METVKIWDFIEKYYPNYQTSDIILENEILQMIVNKEEIESSLAMDIYNEIASHKVIDFISDNEKDSYIRDIAAKRLKDSNLYIYEKAIENYLI